MGMTHAGLELQSLEYDEDSRAYRAEFDRETTSPSAAVITALSAVVDADPTELAPLQYAVDVDALNALVSPNGRPRPDVSVSFRTDGHAVTVRGDGSTTIAPAGADSTAHRNEGVSHE